MRRPKRNLLMKAKIVLKDCNDTIYSEKLKIKDRLKILACLFANI